MMRAVAVALLALALATCRFCGVELPCVGKTDCCAYRSWGAPGAAGVRVGCYVKLTGDKEVATLARS